MYISRIKSNLTITIIFSNFSGDVEKGETNNYENCIDYKSACIFLEWW